MSYPNRRYLKQKAKFEEFIPIGIAFRKAMIGGKAKNRAAKRFIEDLFQHPKKKANAQYPLTENECYNKEP